MRAWSRWGVVFAFSAAMGWLEAAVVLYLRLLVDRLQPYQPYPLPFFARLGQAELIREAATLVMLASVGWLAGRSWRSRLAHAMLAFGMWDLAYYAFLRVLTGWPATLLDWDVLFLLPLPWWGPVLAPMLIGGLMILGGSLVAVGDQPEDPLWPRRRSSRAAAGGALVAVAVFMVDALRALPDGATAVQRTLPTGFLWGPFAGALALMTIPIVDLSLQVWSREHPIPATAPRFGASPARGTIVSGAPSGDTRPR
jgi:hypothetical protein